MDIAQELHRYREQIELALLGSPTGLTFEELPGLIESGRLGLFANDHAILIAEPVPHDRGWVMSIFIVAGKLDAAQALIDRAEQVAKDGGAVAVATIGRPGWIREARRRGYLMSSATFTKLLK